MSYNQKNAVPVGYVVTPYLNCLVKAVQMSEHMRFNKKYYQKGKAHIP